MVTELQVAEQVQVRGDGASDLPLALSASTELRDGPPGSQDSRTEYHVRKTRKPGERIENRCGYLQPCFWLTR